MVILYTSGMKKILLPALVVTTLVLLLLFIGRSNDRSAQKKECDAYDYITQKKGCTTEAVQKRYPNITLNTEDPKKSLYDPDLELENGYTLLTYATEKGNMEFAQLLIGDKKADVNKRDDRGNSILTIFLRQKKYRKASFVFEELKVTLTKDERMALAKQAKKDPEAQAWAEDHDIIIKDDTTLNKEFYHQPLYRQIEIIQSDVNLSKKNITLLRETFANGSLYDIYEYYEQAAHLLGPQERMKIFEKIISDSESFNDFQTLMDALISDGITLSTAQAQNIRQQVMHDRWYHAEPKNRLFLYLYEQHPDIFDKDTALREAMEAEWLDAVQILIDDGAKDQTYYKTLKPDKYKTPLVALLSDNGYHFSKEQWARYNKNIKDYGPGYYQYLQEEQEYLALAADPDALYIAELDHKSNRLDIQKQDGSGKQIYKKTLEGRHNHNSVNRLFGLYTFGGKLLLVEQKVQERALKTVITVLDKEASLLKRLTFDGKYRRIVFSPSHFFVETSKERGCFDSSIEPVKRCLPAERHLQKEEDLFNRDRTKVKELQDKTLRLNYYDQDHLTRLYIDPLDGQSSVHDLLKEEEIAVDIAQTQDANFLLVKTIKGTELVKMNRDFGVDGYHYVTSADKDDEESKLSTMEHIAKTIILKDKSVLVIGKKMQLPTLERYGMDKSMNLDISYRFAYLRGHISDAKELDSGDILIIGRLYENYNIRKVFTALLTPEGRPRWSRVYDAYHYIDDIILEEDGTFMTLADYTPLKLSLKDGSLIRQYKEIPDADEIVHDGTALYAIGNRPLNKNSRAKKLYQPILYCYSKDGERFTRQLVGRSGYYIRDIYSEDGTIYAYLELPKEEHTLDADTLIVQITPECKVDYKWKK